jgi:hypothetical protein
MERNTGTIFKVYLLAESVAGLEEGYVQLWKHKGAIQGVRNVPFNHLAEIPDKIRRQLKGNGIKWPKNRGKVKLTTKPK